LTADSADLLTLRRCALLSAMLVLIAALRIVSTYTALSHTVDEPIHLGAGMEWLDHGTMTGDVSHPPMARVLSAIGPYLAGERWTPTGNTTTDGLAVLGRDGHYDRMLALARLGVLPLFAIASVMVFLWGNRMGGPLAGLIATFLFTTIPPVLAHAGQVTTDMAATAFTAAGAYAGLVWAERPDRWRTVALGFAVGLGMIAKYSLVVFLPGVWVAVYLCHWRGMRAVPGQLREHWRQAAVAAAIACLVIWAGFRFSFGPLTHAHVSLPAPRFFDGWHDIWRHNQEGHASYILGRRHHFGVWYFFPVTLGVKTPLAMLLLAAWSLWTAWRRRLKIAGPLAYCAVILAIAMSSRINLGVRHVLPIYVGLAVIAGVASAAWLRESPGRLAGRWLVMRPAVLFALFGWQVVSGALAHPDYLSYSNEITRGRPEAFVAESDLDWGQDMHRVGDFLKRAGATEVAFTPYNVTYLQAGHAFPKVTYNDWYHASPGWNVVSLSGWKVYNHPGWIGERQPQFRIGRTHWAWYFKAGEEAKVGHDQAVSESSIPQ
jgi:4-amino-4-deoxy-L-arabinose transferase-like glycosyltransferase